MNSSWDVAIFPSRSDYNGFRSQRRQRAGRPDCDMLRGKNACLQTPGLTKASLRKTAFRRLTRRRFDFFVVVVKRYRDEVPESANE